MCITFTAFKTYLQHFLESICVTLFQAEPVSNRDYSTIKADKLFIRRKFMTLYSLLYKCAKFALNFGFNLFFSISCVYLCADFVLGLLGTCECLFIPAKRFQVIRCGPSNSRNSQKFKFSKKSISYSYLICAVSLYFTQKLLKCKKEKLARVCYKPQKVATSAIS